MEINIDVWKIVQTLRDDTDISAITTNIYHGQLPDTPDEICVYMEATPINHDRVNNRALLTCMCIWNSRNVTRRTLNDLRLKINKVLKETKDFYGFKVYRITQQGWPWEIYDEKGRKIVHKNFDVSYLR